jgi:hypothetical protein
LRVGQEQCRSDPPNESGGSLVIRKVNAYFMILASADTKQPTEIEILFMSRSDCGWTRMGHCHTNVANSDLPCPTIAHF